MRSNKVCLGVVVKDMEVLLVRNKNRPHLWSFPAGAIGKNEHAIDCVERDTPEISGIRCKCSDIICEDGNDVYVGCDFIGGLPEPLGMDVDESQFIPIEEVERFIVDGVPSDVMTYLNGFI